MSNIELKGKYSDTIIYTDLCEEEAMQQIFGLLNHEISINSHPRFMPDIHAGKGCVIGTTMHVIDKIIPNLVGVDIGCGMYVVKIKEKDINFEKLDEACHFIPSGMNVWDGRKEKFDLTELKCYRNLNDSARLERSIGTLGGGNHFIELDKDDEGNYYLVIHSGSRNLGKQVAEYYQKVAVEINSVKEGYEEEKNRIISEYKSNGKRKQIQKKLEELKIEYKKNLGMPKEMAFLFGDAMNDYIHDIEICQRFAKRNREKMAEIILERCGYTSEESFTTIHNYIDTREMILRKGAIAAHSGEKVLIPLNMRDGSLICVGKGNPEWNCSAPHGAGRIMSRSQAKELLDIEEFELEMEGIYTTCVGYGTIDESPMAYKPSESIIDNIKDTVDIIKVIKPVYNFKAS